eukprot:Nk52_evm112s151 gene=Nk52_evmTU112s151
MAPTVEHMRGVNPSFEDIFSVSQLAFQKQISAMAEQIQSSTASPAAPGNKESEKGDKEEHKPEEGGGGDGEEAKPKTRGKGRTTKRNTRKRGEDTNSNNNNKVPVVDLEAEEEGKEREETDEMKKIVLNKTDKTIMSWVMEYAFVNYKPELINALNEHKSLRGVKELESRSYLQDKTFVYYCQRIVEGDFHDQLCKATFVWEIVAFHTFLRFAHSERVSDEAKLKMFSWQLAIMFMLKKMHVVHVLKKKMCDVEAGDDDIVKLLAFVNVYFRFAYAASETPTAQIMEGRKFDGVMENEVVDNLQWCQENPPDVLLCALKLHVDNEEKEDVDQGAEAEAAADVKNEEQEKEKDALIELMNEFSSIRDLYFEKCKETRLQLIDAITDSPDGRREAVLKVHADLFSEDRMAKLKDTFEHMRANLYESFLDKSILEMLLEALSASVMEPDGCFIRPETPIDEEEGEEEENVEEESEEEEEEEAQEQESEKENAEREELSLKLEDDEEEEEATAMPIGKEDEEQIYASAGSPDGNIENQQEEQVENDPDLVMNTQPQSSNDCEKEEEEGEDEEGENEEESTYDSERFTQKFCVGSRQGAMDRTLERLHSARRMKAAEANKSCNSDEANDSTIAKQSAIKISVEPVSASQGERVNFTDEEENEDTKENGHARPSRSLKTPRSVITKRVTIKRTTISQMSADAAEKRMRKNIRR